MTRSESVEKRKKPMPPNPRSLGIKARVRKRKKAKVDGLRGLVNRVLLMIRKTKPIKASLRLFRKNAISPTLPSVLGVLVSTIAGGGAGGMLSPPLPKRLQQHRERKRAEKVLGSRKRLTQRSVRSEERRVGKECRSRWSPY